MSLRFQKRNQLFVRQLTILAMVIQPCQLLAAVESNGQATPGFVVSRSAEVADVELHSGGVLSGQVVDSSGIGMPGIAIRLSNGQKVWNAATDEKGYFVMANLTGATYQIVAAQENKIFRAWAKGTAPPKAGRGLMVVQTTDVVRGQRTVSPNTNQFFRVSKQRLANPVIFGGIVATAVAIPVAIHNADDDDAPATP